MENLDDILQKVNENKNKIELKEKFLRELKPEDITNKSLECLYTKWLIRYYSE